MIKNEKEKNVPAIFCEEKLDLSVTSLWLGSPDVLNQLYSCIEIESAKNKTTWFSRTYLLFNIKREIWKNKNLLFEFNILRKSKSH